jgi:hypothetical protein
MGAALAIGAITAGTSAIVYEARKKTGRSKEVTTATDTLSNVQSSYAKAVIDNVQTCAQGPSAANVISLTGNFNTLNNITQTLIDNQTLECSFTAVNQQKVQQSILSDLVAQATSNVTAPVDIDTPFGDAGNGPLLNSVDVDINSLQQAVAYTIANSVQHCGVSNGCVPDSSGSACFGCNDTGNALCVTGNFNQVQNIDQYANLNTLEQCYFSVTNNQAITQNLNSAMQATAKAATSNNFTALGWIVFFALFFILIGFVFIVLRWLWRKASDSSAQAVQANNNNGNNNGGFLQSLFGNNKSSSGGGGAEAGEAAEAGAAETGASSAVTAGELEELALLAA